MRRIATPTALVVLLLSPLPAAAAITNVQALFAAKPEPGLHGAAEASVDWRTGSTERLFLKGALTGVGSFGDHVIMGTASGELGRSDGETILSKAFEHVRYRLYTWHPVIGEVFAQHEYDAFRRLQLRALVGVGPRIEVFDADEVGLAVGLALMLEREQLAVSGQTDDGDTFTDLRFSSYILGRVTLMENIDFVETFYVQPRADRFSDLRLLNESSVSIRANDYVSFGVSFLVSYDAQPPLGVSPLDTQLKTSVKVGF